MKAEVRKSDPFTGLMRSDVKIFDVTVACCIGFGKAVLLRHLHWRIQQKRKSPKYKDNPVVWIFDSYEAWTNEISCFSYHSIRNWFKELEDDGLIRSRNNVGKYSYNRVKEYTIEYPTLHEMCRKYELSLHSQGGQKWGRENDKKIDKL